MIGEPFVRGLAAALPEAFAGIDLVDEYDFSAEVGEDEVDEDGWGTTLALGHAVRWIEERALAVSRRSERTAIRPEGEEPLRRFFAHMEAVIADTPEDEQGWIAVELFEGVPWTEDVIDVLGPHTRALLRRAQVQLAPYNGWIGRWRQ